MTTNNYLYAIMGGWGEERKGKGRKGGRRGEKREREEN